MRLIRSRDESILRESTFLKRNRPSVQVLRHHMTTAVLRHAQKQKCRRAKVHLTCPIKASLVPSLPRWWVEPGNKAIVCT